MTEELSRSQRFKRYMKRTFTRTWAKHFSYQVFALIVSIVMIIGVANYAVTKSYDERKLRLADDFTITAHQGAFETNENSVDFVKRAVNNNVDVLEIVVRQRIDGTLVMSNDILVSANDGVLLTDVFALVRDTDIVLNFNIKETRVLNKLHDLIIEYSLFERSFLTGIGEMNISALKNSSCADMDYYLELQPSRLKIFGDDYSSDIIEKVKKAGAIGVSCKYNYAGARLAEHLHKSGLKLSVDGVNTKNVMKRILMAQADNVVTKQYDLLVLTINNWGK